ncbi:hypothetical protein A3I40_01330 [Candidatus Uhrbacteria bacterium RIFCSPLOWO2_02_FULL_48_12]|uniref:Probable DNA 3'-5' helicase RecG n=1 Tax=Candidatus Uhrbacteria bacterium RIFCSPLOWO2_02_FULL_48_12 TaxID=1802407 RepID=A0A1F7VAL1_9BACT|nr:MAG: hypothetical protein A3I40_01330 [Candidatus Uhrbacteria bacterium RIFCSPLOWO2_02_FULL_48_12]
MYSRGTPLSDLKGIGRATAAAFRRLAISTVGDLVYHLPADYEDFRQQYSIAAAPLGAPATLKGSFISFDNRPSWHKRRLAITEGLLQDDTGAMRIIWFGQPYIARAVPLHTPLYISGTIELYQGARQMTNPVWERVSDSPVHTSRLVPWYGLTRGLTQKQMRFFIETALNGLAVEDWFHEKFRQQHRLMAIAAALRTIHFPDNEVAANLARRRLAFDELFFLQISRLFLRERRQTLSAPQISKMMTPMAMTAPLGIKLTSDQERAVVQIFEDLKKSYPMQRLLQGEVGSGKTLVAVMAAAAAALNGYQVLYLAPTEVLAHQQYEIMRQWLAPFGVSAVLLTRSRFESSNMPAAGRSAVLKALADGTANVAVGTHALLQRQVRFKNIGLVVVDEQHRFGVKQRMAAQYKTGGLTPHLLSMTATPIPRTLQLAFLGDLDISTLRAMPHGQRIIKTFLFGPPDRRRVEIGIRRRIDRGEQVFVVCPLIDPSDKLGVKSVTAEYERLREEAFPQAKIGLLHGKLKSGEKENILRAFRDGRLQMLVATTVIEVGLDIAGATIIVIEDAERFGLAELHQLRGRVGRRGKEGICALFTSAASSLARRRLEAFARTTDAFQLAEQDLKLRGPGEWFGAEQSGFTEFKVADLNDAALLAEARSAAMEIINSDPNLASYNLIRLKVDDLLSKEHHLS